MKKPESQGEYMVLQTELIGRFIGHGGTAEAWISQRAAAFREKYGPLAPAMSPPRPEPNRS